MLKEPGNPFVMAIVEFIMFLLSTFGISDFAIGAAVYPKLKWVSDKKLPGTLNTECVIPVVVMALSYISSIQVDILTLVCAISAQVLGAYVSPRYVVKLPAKIIKQFVATGLIIAAALIIGGELGWLPSGGSATGLTGGKLVLLTVLSFVYGALNNIGIGSYALTSATVYALGLTPIAAFPIMMGACTFSVGWFNAIHQVGLLFTQDHVVRCNFRFVGRAGGCVCCQEPECHSIEVGCCCGCLV